jgi:phosphohistidine phosphatase
VYLVRHEEAGEAENDADRVLTGLGRRRMRATGKLVAAQPGRIDWMFSSPLLRAVQTAEILAGEVGLDEPLVIRPEIASPPNVRSLVRLLESVPAGVEGVAMVGHEPTLGVLTSTLLGSSSKLTGVRKGAVIALETDRAGAYSFRWMILPDGPHRVDSLATP